MARKRKRNEMALPAESSPPSALDAKQNLALGLMLQGEPVATTAKAVGVTRSTLWRWTQKPEFAQALAAIQEDLRSDTRRYLRQLSRAAADELASLLEDEDSKIRLQAACAILDRAGVKDPDQDGDERITLLLQLLTGDTEDAA